MQQATPARPILMVDDSPSLRALLGAALSAGGFPVAEAEDGVTALEWLSANDPALVITDITMPRLDGFSFIAQLRAHDRFRNTPVLVLTTEAAPDKKHRARTVGATGWISKPFDPDKLNTAVRRILE